MRENKTKVAIIILNWNGWKDTIECLESVFRIDYPNYQVIVVDNGSTDDSVEKIKVCTEGKIKVISNFFEFKYDLNKKPIEIIGLKREDEILPKNLYVISKRK
jgi:glycosyltransferase involved in cell wall biosynthesis